MVTDAKDVLPTRLMHFPQAFAEFVELSQTRQSRLTQLRHAHSNVRRNVLVSLIYSDPHYTA